LTYIEVSSSFVTRFGMIDTDIVRRY